MPGTENIPVPGGARSQTRLRVIAGVLALAAVATLALVLVLQSLAGLGDPPQWPVATTAAVTDVTATAHVATPGSSRCDVAYAFVVDGTTHTATRESSAEAACTLQPGDSVGITYDPDDLTSDLSRELAVPSDDGGVRALFAVPALLLISSVGFAVASARKRPARH